MTVDIEQRVGFVLMAGSILSTALLAIGLLVSLLPMGETAGSLLVQAGLIIVLATPVARVFVSMVGFVQQRDWRFVLMTLAVLGVLAGSVVAAFD